MNYVHCLVSFSTRGHRPEGINYLLLGMKIGLHKNDCHNSVASHGIAISGIHMPVIAQLGGFGEGRCWVAPLLLAHSIDRQRTTEYAQPHKGQEVGNGVQCLIDSRDKGGNNLKGF